MSDSAAQEVVPGVHRFSDAGVNWYSVLAEGDLWLIDSGWPRSRAAVLAGLRAIGATPSELRGVLLTHGHPDHLGTANWLSEEHGVPVYAGAAELARVRGEAPSTRGPSLVTYLWRPPALRFIALAVSRGVASPQWVASVRRLEDAGLRSILAISLPGHTEGHTAYLLPPAQALFTGDALVTRDVLTGATGPRLHPTPFQVDLAQAGRSLGILAELEAEVVLPGHGDPYRGSPAAAVAAVPERSQPRSRRMLR